MMSTQPAAHATAYHNYGLKEVLFGWAAENFTGTLLLWQVLHFSKIQWN